MTTPELLTKEEERVWLATYEASLSKDAGIKRSMDVAMEAVQEWRKLVPTGEAARQQESESRAREDMASMRDDALARLEDAERARKTIGAQWDKARDEIGTLEAERNSLQEDLAAMKERIRSLEASSAACHQDLAAVREALGVHNSPERSAAECVRPVVAELRALYNASLRAK